MRKAPDDQHGQRSGTVASYQGRRLPRPQDEVVDQGLGFDVVTLVNRRQALRAFGLGAAVAGLAACGSSATTGTTGSTGSSAAGTATAAASGTSAAGASGEIPDETAGPYPGDGSNGPDVLQDSGVVRSDIRSSFAGSNGTAEGVPMTLELAVADLAGGGAAYAGAAVYVWHCDREGRYSMYSNGITDQNYLRGVQIADNDGKVRFSSVFPGCYDGRWPHIHFEVYPRQGDITDATKAVATSQVALPKDASAAVYATAGYESSIANLARVSLDTDNVFGDDGGALQLGTATGDTTTGYTLTLAVRVDTRTTPTTGQAGSRAGGGPGGPPPAGPSGP
jgi:protocatechuate 3,4-dioxygenase beta subunit